MEIKITKNPNPAVKPEPSVLGFGKYFTDHMFMMDYAEGKGWHNARIIPFGPIAIHPASTIFGLFTPEQCTEMSVPDTTVRLSIGLEAGEDLLEDIKTAIK